MMSLFSVNNTLIQQATLGKRITPLWAVIPLTFMMLILAQLGAIIPVIFMALQRMTPEQLSVTLTEGQFEAIATQIQPQTPVEFMIFLVSAFLGIYVLVGLWVKFFERRRFASLGLVTLNPFRQFWRGFLIGGGMFILAVIPGLLFGQFTVEAGPVLTWTSFTGIGMLLVGWLVQGPAEELIFRGWVLPVIAARYQVWLGIVVSSILFGVVHGLNDNISPLAILNLFLFGVFAAVYALNEGSIWGVCGLHAVWNWVQGNILGLAVSGMRPGQVSLFFIAETGFDSVTGGAFGPEGGLLVTLMLCAAIGFVVYRQGVNRDGSE